MSIHPFDWRDLPALHRYRNQSVFLNSALVLTRGPMLLSGALLSTLAPGMGLMTAVWVSDGDAARVVIGQSMHIAGTQCSQLTFLTPEELLEAETLAPLLEHFARQAVERGAFRLLADVDEGTPAFDALRGVGFAIYARQRIWRLMNQPGKGEGAGAWRPVVESDLIAVRSLYNNLIPGMVQQVEPFPADRLRGMVYCQGDDLLAYVELKYGHRGIWAQPFIHPDAEPVAAHLVSLFQYLTSRYSRPLYVCVRSYQSWLEPAIESLGAEAGSRQAIMVKHLALPQKVVRAYALPALEGGRPEITAPIARLPAESRLEERL